VAPTQSDAQVEPYLAIDVKCGFVGQNGSLKTDRLMQVFFVDAAKLKEALNGLRLTARQTGCDRHAGLHVYDL